MIKLINRYYKNLWLKITGTFEKLQTNHRKASTSSKNSTFVKLMQNSVGADTKAIKKNQIPSKDSKTNPLVLKSVSEPIANLSVKVQ